MRQSGRTMLETLAVIAIVGILTIGAVSMYTRSREKLTRMSTINEVEDLSENIKTLFQGKSDYGLLTISYLQRYGALRNNRNAYGKEFIVRPSEGGQGFIISYEELSQADCIFYGLSEWKSAKEVWLNGSAVRRDAETSEDLQCQEGAVNILNIEFE